MTTGIYGVTEERLAEFEKDKGTSMSVLYKGKVRCLHNPDKHPRYLVNFKKNGKWETKEDGKPKWQKPTSVTTITGIKDKSEVIKNWALGVVETRLVEHLRGGVTLEEEFVRRVCAKPDEELRKASDIGKKIHDWAEKYIMAKLEGRRRPNMPKDKTTLIGVMSFLDWENEHKIEWVGTEDSIYSMKHDYSGRLDIKAVVDGKLCIVDLKTSNGLYNEVRMQTAAYLMADQEESGRKYDGRWAVRLAKETEEEYNARMDAKDSRAQMLGKRVYKRPDYKVFEAKYLDEDDNLEADFQAFLSAKALFDWNRKNYKV